MSFYSIRTRKEELETQRKLTAISDSVEVASTLPARMKEIGGKGSIFFDNVIDYDMPVVSGMFGDRQSWADYWDIDVNGITRRIKEAIAHPLQWEIVPKGTCQETTLNLGNDLTKIFPAPKFNRLDSGQFITSAVVHVMDSGSNKIHTSIRRIQVNKENLSIFMTNSGLLNKFRSAEADGKDLDIAIVIGSHPELLLASQLNSYLYDVDKMALAGALTGVPVPMVKCQTVDCYVPADSEIVFEGKIVAGKRRPEGPFGELADGFGKRSDKPIIHINRVTCRENPWFQAIHPLSDDDHKLPGALMREVLLFDAVKRVLPSVKNVHFTLPGAGLFHAVVSIRKRREGQGKMALLAALGGYTALKHVVIVDDDVDIFDSADVEWAVATRVQAERDVVIIDGVCGTSLDPSLTDYRTGSKMGIDATYPLADKKEYLRTSQT